MPELANLSARQLRERLAGTRLPQDPTAVVMPPGSEDWPPDMRAALTRRLKPSGVLIPILEREPHMTVLLTRRSAALKHHAGQVSFPGGRMEKRDADVEACALRETEEEIGIGAESITVLGYLDPLPTSTGYAVTPVVGMVSIDARVVVDPDEVDIAFEVPLGFLLDPDNAKVAEREVRGYRIPVVEFHFSGHRIWGATAHMLVNLRKKLLKNNK